MEWSVLIRDGAWNGMAQDDHREEGREVKTPGDEVGGLGERSHRVLRCNRLLDFQSKR